MKVAGFLYKCRRCGKIDKNPHIAESKALSLLMELVVFKGPGPVANETGGITADLLYVCHCDDGGMGISDLQGCDIDEEGS